MKIAFQIAWFGLSLFFGLTGRLEACLICLVMSKLWEIQIKLDEPFALVHNDQQEEEKNGKE